MERTGQGQDKEVWGMLKQIKVITVYLQRNKKREPILDHNLYRALNKLLRAEK